MVRTMTTSNEHESDLDTYIVMDTNVAEHVPPIRTIVLQRGWRCAELQPANMHIGHQLQPVGPPNTTHFDHLCFEFMPTGSKPRMGA